MKKLVVAKTWVEHWKEFAETKLSLQKKGYPMDETLIFVKNIYDTARKKILPQIKYPSILFVVPSASGQNIIPSIFAELIRIDFSNKCTILNQDMTFARCNYYYESKNRRIQSDKLSTPVDFTLSNLDVLKEYVNTNIPFFIVDDICCTGETVVNLRKRLEQNGIPVKGIVAMVSRRDSFIEKRELREFIYLIKRNPAYLTKTNAIKKDVETYLSGYLPNKLSKTRQLINPEFPDQIDKAVDTIRAGAALYRQIGLDH